MFEKPSVADLREAAQKLGMTPSDAYLAAVEEIIAPIAAAYATLDKTPDELPPVKYPRREFHLPTAAENPHGACTSRRRSRAKRAASFPAGASRSRTISASPACR